ncbi:phosphoenolpyruvate--protein phosphotransferase [Shewanella gelidii]|uniref:Phosphoenolpyruvate-protein phosphotransferase n=1 Tax=Shewanella gelidii TaxID=1642821 RepID=A0A917JVJ2_9GAMM|nr:phosphoenolpyruvate--protein phosphotransferase [Shewanella gelidii]MCL1098578.1 phosphoenolpyruvate--protein phosphotransferase [Shewanella gelidii]GGI86948.1 phosphoenolpyruvate-protein phosphotransferase [Shewanella gelidii]
MIKGIAVSSGIAFGQALKLQPYDNSLDYRLLPFSKISEEQQNFRDALQELVESLQDAGKNLSRESDNYQLIEADLLLLEDEELIHQIINSIRELQFSASAAVERVFEHQASELESLNDDYLASRADDVRGLGKRLISAINGTLGLDLSKLQNDTILLAQDITPAEFAILPLKRISGIVLQTGGLNSHTAILAKAAGIPALLSCHYQDQKIKNGDSLILDALSGELHVKPDEELQQILEEKYFQEAIRRQNLLAFKDKPVYTTDHHKVTLLANVGNLNEIKHLSDVGADGIGLFRTEFMVMNAKKIPDEQAQYLLYCNALQSLEGNIFTIRTLDIGADKELPSLSLDSEENPALGLRGIRYCLAHPELLRTQLRAVLRASYHGPIRLMFPMVNHVEEIDQIFAMVARCEKELHEEEMLFGEVSYGIVVETPAAVMNLDSMLDRLDFVSIGTNDLTQYAMAADRTNPSLNKDYPSFSPAILKLVKMTIDTAKSNNVRVALCGELASDPQIAPILVGMGLDELSVSLGSMLEIKSAICQCEYKQLKAKAKEILTHNRIESLQASLSENT